MVGQSLVAANVLHASSDVHDHELAIVGVKGVAEEGFDVPVVQQSGIGGRTE